MIDVNSLVLDFNETRTTEQRRKPGRKPSGCPKEVIAVRLPPEMIDALDELGTSQRVPSR